MRLSGDEFKDKCPSSPWCGPGSFAGLREAQQKIVETVAGTGLAVGIDIGDARNVHPVNKQEAGRRLALVALKQVYQQDVIADGPAVTDARFEPGRMTLAFDAGGKGQSLVFKDSATNGFELAGADGHFLPATAQLKGNTIVLTVAAMAVPCAVRYAWADNPSLFNTAGLPAAPFRKTAVPPVLKGQETNEFVFTGVTKDFDLSKSPKDWIKTQPIINAMLELGEKHIYKKVGDEQLPFWLFRPDGMGKGETRPCVMFIHGGSWSGKGEHVGM